MRITFPSPEFDDAVAAVCDGSASEEHMRALNERLSSDVAARDEYILRVELHARLASESELFADAAADDSVVAEKGLRLRASAFPPAAGRRGRTGKVFWALGIAASLALVASAAWLAWPRPAAVRVVATRQAVAMLQESANARWVMTGEGPRLGAPLEPGLLILEAGLAQVVFYSGARVVIEGPAELELISANHAVCRRGKITAEVPPQARGFRIDTPQGKVTDLGTAFGLEVNAARTEVHVFEGEVRIETTAQRTDEMLREGSGAVIEAANVSQSIAADPGVFASLFDMQARSAAAEALRVRQWRAAGADLNRDPSLIVRFDFDETEPSRRQVPNVSAQGGVTGDATIIGCQWGEGRWPGKRAIEFQGVSDRVRLSVPGESDALTLAAWVRVRGLDRKLNSLFMSDGFATGSAHWLIRNDGVLGVTIVGERPGSYQIVKSPPVLTLDRFGIWMHLAVVVDGRAGRVTHFVNGQPVSESALHIKPPFRIGTAELGNWNAKGFPKNDPFMIRNFSGAMDEFCLFLRPLNVGEIAALYAEGRPDAEVLPSPK